MPFRDRARETIPFLKNVKRYFVEILKKALESACFRPLRVGVSV
jgi:hypothetical protein